MTYGDVAVSDSPKKWHLLIERLITLKLAEYGFSSAYFLSPKVCANDKWPSVNFTNVLWAAFAQVDPKSVNNTVKSCVSFYAFVICERKCCTWNVDEFEP